MTLPLRLGIILYLGVESPGVWENLDVMIGVDNNVLIFEFGATSVTIKFKEYTVDIIDEPTFSIRSADNLFIYDKVYFDNAEYQPTSKHGIRVGRHGKTIQSALICETGGPTVVHENSFIISGCALLICCCHTVYSFEMR